MTINNINNPENRTQLLRDTYEPVNIGGKSIEQLQSDLILLTEQMSSISASNSDWLMLFAFKIELTVHLEFLLLTNNERK